MGTVLETAGEGAFENKGDFVEVPDEFRLHRIELTDCLHAVQAITSGSLAALSDITAQKLVSNAPLNWRRTLALALFGLVWSGPSIHYWQKFTNQLFKGKKDAGSVAQKVY